MLVSRKLLGRYVNIDGIATAEIADTLTNAGIEVEGISTLIQGTKLVVGHVLECEPHPDSDHLNVTQVDLGTHVEQIVCGASNIAKGQYVVVATVGAELKDLTIKETTIRGVESKGMICSLNELGVAEKFQTEAQKEGIVVLPKAEPGSNPAIALGLDDEIMDVSQTPNRSDFLSIFAIAHEISALFNRELTIPDYEGKSDIGKPSQLKISSQTEKAPLFYGKVIGSVTIKESPAWIREALIGSGMKPINNVVDISNIVMLETGQPLHFYDIDFLANQTLSVRDDISGEFAALDDNTYAVQAGDLMIMNDETPVGIAGIMGLGNSMIQSTSRGIIIEAARFNNVSVRKTATRLGLNSEASARFTKPMDNKGTQKAVDRAVQLLIDYADASLIEETVKYGSLDTTPITVSITTKRINDYLGTSLSQDVVVDVFQRLFFEPQLQGDVITCTIPSFRKDIAIDVDLIEEVIRVVGYDVLEETLPLMDLTSGSLSAFQTSIRLIESSLLGFGANQINSYTLVDEAKTKGMESLGTAIRLMSPISDKRAYLRTQLFPSMLEVLAYNNSHKVVDGLYFEHSAIYAEGAKTWRLGIIGQGQLFDDNWTKTTVSLDFYNLKGLVMALFDKLGYSEKRFSFEVKNIDETSLHPYKSAEILLNRKHLGVIGHIHPTLAKELDLKDAVYVEIDLDFLLSQKSGAVKATPVAKYPIMKRDLAILCDTSIKVQDLIQAIEKASRRYLVDLNVFDVFTSEKLGDKKSIAFELSFGQNRTLEVEEINDIMKSITDELTSRFGVEVR
ncbi:phenylalanine--tRNA ligase subunit beta [Erysipelothrix sp. HDW6C]|uniref:phenylalanine--tRNA ligase subunit beta n=1 Tax=Erysipelothrix sp. HDW6C TaxID=2714930 RepID=UPI00140AC5E1|nr:phenylalanine--tRNA ligase subunit beta [Erysipelothrix sp. HDW6C]QIK70139.1 phenylalanine--tRNA ligase subunit beta [Erysipelothrix sp. HDW6C]